MSTQHFPLEFKEETVKQATERGDPVAEVSARQGFQPQLVQMGASGQPKSLGETGRRADRGQERNPSPEGPTASHRKRARYSKKSRAVLCQEVRVRYRCMNEHRHTWPLTTMCRLLQVARAGFYQ